MKILFVTEPFSVEPLGIAYLASALKSKGHEVDLVKINNNGYLDEISALKPEVVAFSVTTGRHKKLLDINRKIKSRLDVISVFGGSHPTYFPEVQNEEGVDYIIRGEADKSFPKLLEDLEIKGESEKEVKFEKLEQDLDSLPYPDREFLYKYPENHFNPIKNVLMSRGCAFSCPYCFNSLYKSFYKGEKFVRYRTPRNVIGELLELKNKYPTKFIFFQDDEILSNPYFYKFMDLYKEKIDIPFHCQLRIELLTWEKAITLKKSGCTGVTFAVESGDQFERKEVLKRNMTDEQIINGAKILHDVDLKFRTENMVGLPGETLKQMYKTVELNKKLKPTIAWASIFQPYPRLPIGEQARVVGFWDGNDAFMESFFEDTVLKTTIRKEIVNLQRIFGFVVYYQLPIGIIDRLIRVPKNKCYDNLYKSWKESRYKILFN
jgi:radical SAM superfamily enzyme YgiQ (UPF0313 family)